MNLAQAHKDAIEILYTKQINSRDMLVKLAQDYPAILVSIYNGKPVKPSFTIAAHVAAHVVTPVVQPSLFPIVAPVAVVKPTKRVIIHNNHALYTAKELKFIGQNFTGGGEANKELAVLVNKTFHNGKCVRTGNAIATQYSIMKKNNTLPKPYKPRPRITNAEIELIKELQHQGLSPAEISERCTNALGNVRTQKSIETKISRLRTRSQLISSKAK